MERGRFRVSKHRWPIMAASFVIMMIISIYQYSWFLFAYAIQRELNWNLAAIGLTFTVFAYTATFVQPFSGFIADSYGPRKVAVGASVLVGMGFVFASFARTPSTFYVFYGLGGLGVGILYGISTACAVKWFPDRRGFAVGLIVFGFGAGTVIFNWIIQGILEIRGLGATFMVLGCGMLFILVPLSLLYRYPGEDPGPASVSLEQGEKTKLTFRSVEMMMTHQWLLIYFSFAVTVSIVLMFGAQMKILAKEFGIPKRYFSLVLVLFPLGNGLSRVLAGAVSDRIGRERTMRIFYSLLGLSIIAFVLFGHNPFLFIVIVFIAALLGGAPFALYPATIGDYYGTRYFTTNYGITYTAKAWAGLISGWLTGYLVMQFGSYRVPMVLVALCSLIAALISSPRFMSPPEKKPHNPPKA